MAINDFFGGFGNGFGMGSGGGGGYYGGGNPYFNTNGSNLFGGGEGVNFNGGGGGGATYLGDPRNILTQGGGNAVATGGGNTVAAGGGPRKGDIATIDNIAVDDVIQDDTPIIPAGAYDYGSGKVYSAFTTEDIVEGGTKRVTRGLWSGNSGELTVFHTSSYQSNTQKQYYYEIYNGDPTVSTNEPQFSVAYGHYAGSGSLGTNEDSPSSAIYSQMQQILLSSNQKKFKFSDESQDDIYAIAINRARIKDRLDPGNWELCISGSAGKPMLRLIDDSGDTDQAGNARQTKYNIVSGSLLNGVQSSAQIYGEVYPQHGIIILGAAAMDASASLGTVRTVSDAQNHNKLFNAISGSAEDSVLNGFQARSEEEIKSTFYFIRAKNAEYNFSNNPTYVSGSEGRLAQNTFVGDPKTYITSVGLYNNDNELLAIAKLSKPILKSFSNEILVKVKLDF